MHMALLKPILANAAQRLQAAGIHSPLADAEIIIVMVLGFDRAQLKLKGGEEIIPDLMEKIESAIAKREQRMPLARIFGRITYRGLNFLVEEGVFEPSPETETILEHAHIYLESRARHRPLRVLDIGSGNGCMLLSLLAEQPHATGIGVDISGKAVDLARRNAEALGLSSRAEFRVSNWFSAIGENEKFDFILCNPPFVPQEMIPHLQPEVHLHDPHLALNGGRDGLDFYRRLARDFSIVAAEDGIGIFQMTRLIEAQVIWIFEKEGYHAQTLRNHFGLPMCIGIKQAEQRKSLWQRLKKTI